jgi:hypothetical protein
MPEGLSEGVSASAGAETQALVAKLEKAPGVSVSEFAVFADADDG